MMSGGTNASLLGERAQVAVERALSEFRSGRPVLITSASDAITALPVDGMTETMLVAFRVLSRPVPPLLLAQPAVRTCEPPLVAVPVEAVAQCRRAFAAALSFAAEATIPLSGFSARFVVWDPAMCAPDITSQRKQRPCDNQAVS